MRAGLLNKRCIIEKPTRKTNELGETVLIWQEVATVWASAWPVTAAETRGVAGVSERVTFEVRMRRKACRELASDYRLRISGHTLEITGILSLDNAEGELWRVQATEVA